MSPSENSHLVLVALVSALLIFKVATKKPRLLKDLKDVTSHAHGRQLFDPEYDIIIVGGGTAGCVLAARLTEEPSLRVLLVESGESSLNLNDSMMPAAFHRLFRTKHDYGLRTVPQQNAGGTRVYWPRARLLGGCTAINAMIFHHCAPSDYDEWPKFLGKTKENSIWSYQGLKKYFLKFETFVPRKDHPDVDVSERGSSGPMKTGYFGHNSYITQQFIRACETIGIPASPDFNTSKGTLGVKKTSSVKPFIDPNGRRVTAENSYLTPDVLKRPNLRVITSATITKVVFDRTGDQPRAAGVEFTSSRDAPRFKAIARKEVILCAGAVHTPHILMLSGIGPAAQLAFYDVPPLVDLPGVGEHLMDHPVIDLNILDKSGHGIGWTRGPVRLKTVCALFQWFWRGTGPLTSTLAEGIAFVRADDPKLFQKSEEPPLAEDSTSGPECPDLELFVSPMGYNTLTPDLFKETAFGVHAVALRPTSLGTVRLTSNDPFDGPVIDPKYLSTQHDVQVLVRGIKALLRVTQAEPLASEVVDRSGDDDPMLDHHLYKATTAEVEEFVRQRVSTLYHPTSTARMARREDGGVVDEELKVYGVRGLRVVDASVFPTIPAGHTAAPTLAVAEKMADLIKAEYEKI